MVLKDNSSSQHSHPPYDQHGQSDIRNFLDQKEGSYALNSQLTNRHRVEDHLGHFRQRSIWLTFVDRVWNCHMLRMGSLRRRNWGSWVRINWSDLSISSRKDRIRLVIIRRGRLRIGLVFGLINQLDLIASCFNSPSIVRQEPILL